MLLYIQSCCPKIIFYSIEPIYQGCYLRNADRTNKHIPTNECFWKDPCYVKNGVNTRSHTKNEPSIGYKAIERYDKQKQFIEN